MRRVLFALVMACVAIAAAGEPPLTVRIVGVTPTTLQPQGADTVRISGSNFRSPVRVFFEADGITKEGFILSVTSTIVTVLAPAFDVGYAQQRQANVVLLNAAGTFDETRVTAPAAVTYRPTILTPRIITLAPDNAPVGRVTRVNLIGEGFQLPMQVFFDDLEAQVIGGTFNQAVVIAPAGHPLGSATVKVANINSNTSASLTNAFRFVNPMTLTSAGPLTGSSLGATRITISGSGFVEPIAVTVAGLSATPLKVTPTEIVALTSPIAGATCSGRSGPIVVTNVDNGDSAQFGTFTYVVPKVFFTSVPPVLFAGSTATVNAGNVTTPRFILGNRTLTVTNASNTKFVINIPRDFVGSCSRVETTITITDVVTGCTDTLPVVVRSPPCGRPDK